jgi:hypothetical protein
VQARSRIEPLAVTVPGYVAVRIAMDAAYVGLKDTFSVGRIERGRSQFWTH